MQKSKGIKIAASLCGAIVVIVGIVLVVSYFFKKEDTYRSILVYELEGKAEIEREKTGSISAAENIYLESGDTLTVAPDSYMRLKLDDDKYIMVEENTVLSIEAAGNEDDSKTKIQLVKGAITSEIQNPLSADSEYEVTSPNSVMAVRGTIFRVETGTVQGDTPCTKTSVFSGKVSMGVRLEDGTVGDSVFIAAGEEGYGEGSDAIESNGIDFSALPPQAIRVLQDLLEQGAPVQGITKSELDKLAEKSDSSDKNAAEDKKDADSVENKDESTDNSQPASSSTENKKQSNNNTSKSRPNTQKAGGNGTGGTPNTESTRPSGNDTINNTPEAGIPSQPSNNGQPDNNNNTTVEKPDDNKKPDDNQKPDDNKKPDDSKTEYTVTFMYQGKVFATQTVKSGQCAKKPTLAPAAFGAWDFDFSTKIAKDTVIQWK